MQSDTCTLASYKCKKKKFVTVLSSLHETVSFEGAKRKPTTVFDFNHTKYGVDIVDAMARLYTTKVSSRRWPVQVIVCGNVYVHIFTSSCRLCRFSATFLTWLV